MKSVKTGLVSLAALSALCELSLAAGDGHRVVYYDPAEAMNWVQDGREVVEFLRPRGFDVVDAAGLVSWLRGRVKSGAPGSVVVIATGILPERAAEPRGPRCIFKQYLDAGGKVVWIGVEPLLYVSSATPPIGRRPWSLGSLKPGGQEDVLGVRRVAPGSHGPPAITDTGRRWGMRAEVDGQLPVPVKQVTKALSASQDGQLAYSWFKNFNPRYPFSGLVRYHAGIYFGKDRALNEDVYRISLFAGRPVEVPSDSSLPRRAVNLSLETSTAVVRGQSLEMNMTVTSGPGAPKRVAVRTVCFDGQEKLFERATALELTENHPKRVTFDVRTDSWALRDYRVKSAVLDATGRVLASSEKTVGVRLVPRAPFPFGQWGIVAETPEQGERIMADLASHNTTMVFLGDVEPVFLASVANQALKHDMPFAIRTSVFYDAQRLGQDPAARMKYPNGQDVPLHSEPRHHTACLGQPEFRRLAAESQRQGVARAATYPAFSGWVFTSDDVHLYDWSCYCAKCVKLFRTKYGIAPPALPSPEKIRAKKGIVPDNDPWVLWNRFRSSDILGGYNSALREATEQVFPDALLGPISGGVPMHVRHGHNPPDDLARFSLLSFYYYPHYLSPIPGYVFACGMARIGNRGDRPLAVLTQSYSLANDYSYADEAFVRNEFYTLLAGGAQAIGFYQYREMLPETWASFAELGAVARRLGPLFARLRPGPAHLGFLAPSTTAVHESGWPMRGGSGFASFINLLRTHHQVEPVGEEEITRGQGPRYKGIIIANIDWLVESCHSQLVKYQQKGGILLVDRDTEVPFPFSRSSKVSQIQRRLRQISFDQSTPTSSGHYPIPFSPDVAHRIRLELDRLWPPFAAAESEDLLIRTSRAGRTTYLWVVDTYSIDEFERLRQGQGNKGDWALKRAFMAARGAYGASVVRKISVQGGPYAPYDLVASKPLTSRQVGDRTEFQVTIPRLGGTLVGLYPCRVARVQLDAPQKVRCGDQLQFHVRVEPHGAETPASYLPLEINVVEPTGTLSRYSYYGVARDGKLTKTISTARNDRAGWWNVRVRELSSGLSANARVEFVRN